MPKNKELKRRANGTGDNVRKIAHILKDKA